MKKMPVLLTVAVLLLLGMATVFAQSGYDLLQKALVKERAEGNVEEAIKLYQRIVREFAGNRALAAKALVQMGHCYEKLGNTEARKAYEQVLRDYPDQPEATEARARLAALVEAAPFQTMRMTRLTHTGKSPYAAISPDGKYVAHTLRDGGKESLWLRQVTTSNEVQIVPPADVHYWTPTFSHDGNYIYYVQYKFKDFRILYQIPALGGTPRKLIVDVDSRVTLSPDDKQLAFLRYSSKPGESALMVANADGTGERELATRKTPNFFSSNGLAWSPDGKTIAVGAYTTPDANIVAMPTGGGPERIIGQKWAQISCLAWVFDGSGLVVSAREQTGSSRQLWQLSYPSGEARRITNDLNSYSDVSLTKNGTALAAVQSELDSSLWVVPQRGPTQARQLTSKTDKQEGLGSLAWTPDGRLVTVRESSLWIRDADGSNPRQFTPRGSYSGPTVSPDGKTVVFGSNRSGSQGIWSIDIDGGNLKQLTRGDGASGPDISPDGKWVVYTSGHSGKYALWRVPIDGGEPVQLTQNLSFSAITPSISPDGKLIAFVRFFDRRVAIMPFEGGEPIKTLDIPSVPADIWATPIHWTPDGQGITYVDRRNGVSNIWSQPLSGGPPKQLTQFTSEDQIRRFAWSRDGKQLALFRATQTSDVVLITNFR